MDYQLEAEAVLLQWNGTGEVESLRFDDEIEPGSTELRLPLTAR